MGKHTKRFATQSLYTAFKSSANYLEPNVSVCDDNRDIYYNKLGLITFTIGNTQYQADYGMTWSDWIISEYNVNSFYIYENYIMESNHYYHVYNVSPEMNIVANTNYLLDAAMDPE